MGKRSRKSKRDVVTQTEEVVGALVPRIPSTLTLTHEIPERRQLEEDAMSVFLAKSEAHMKAKLAAAKAAHASVAKEAQDADNDLRRMLKELADKAAAEVLAELRNSTLMTMLQLPKSLYSRGTTDGPRRQERGWSKMVIAINVCRSLSSNKEENVLVATIKQTPPKALIEAIKQRNELQTKSQKSYEEALAWQKRLTQMSEVERVGRATIAERRLMDSDDGAAVLDALVGQIEAVCNDMG